MKRRNLVNCFVSAFAGIAFAFRRERNMRFHFFAAVLAIAASFWFRVERWELLSVLVAVFLVLITEMINTALEKAVDLSTRKYNDLAHTAKNVAAGAVLFAALFALLVGWLVFAGRIIALLI